MKDGMGNGLSEILKAAVPEPPHRLDPGRLVRAGMHRRRRARLALASAGATALVIGLTSALLGGQGTRVIDTAERLALPPAESSTAPSADPTSRPSTSTQTDVTPAEVAPSSPAPPSADTLRSPAMYPTDGWYLNVVISDELPRDRAMSVVAAARAAGYGDSYAVPDPGLPSQCFGQPCDGVRVGGLTTVVVEQVAGGPDPTLAGTSPEAVQAFREEVATPLLEAARDAGLDDAGLSWLPLSTLYAANDTEGTPAGDPATDVGALLSETEVIDQVRGTETGVPVRAALVEWWEFELTAGGGHDFSVPPRRLVWVVTLMQETAIPRGPAGVERMSGPSSTSVVDASTGMGITRLIGPPVVSADSSLIEP